MMTMTRQSLAPLLAATLACVSPTRAAAQEPSAPPTTREADDTPQVRLSLAEGFRIVDPAHKASFHIGYLGWIRYAMVNAPNTTTSGFAMPLARPYMTADILNGQMRFNLQAELAGGTPKLLDAEVFQNVGDGFALHIGQYRPHLSRGWRTGLPVLALPGRGPVQDSFHPTRAIGVTAYGTPLDGKLEYYVGLFNGPSPASGVDHPRLATARLAWNPLGPTPYTQTPWFSGLDGARLSVGFNGMWQSPQEVDDQGAPVDVDQLTGSLDVALLTSRWSWTTEAFARQTRTPRQDTIHTWGAYTIVSALMPTTMPLDLAARAGVKRRDDDTIGQSYELGVNLYPERHDHLKLSVYSQVEDRLDTSTDGFIYRLGAQIQLWL